MNLPPDPKLASEVLKHNSKLQESLIRAGWLGKFFGTNSRVPVYIAGLTIFLLLLTGISYSFLSLYRTDIPFDNVIKLWGIVTPGITLSLGYIFGKGTRSSGDSDE